MTAHIHKFKRTKLGKDYVVFKCMVPNCPTYLPRELAVGRVSLCWRCNTELLLTMENTTTVKPVHKQCKQHREVAA